MKHSMSHVKIKINLFLAALFLILISATNVQAQVQTARYNTSMTSNTNGFYEYLPQGYSSSGTTLYPLLIFIHGMGEYGSGSTSSLPEVLKHGPPKLIKYGTFPTSFSVNGKTFKFIVLSPQWKSQASAANVNGVIDYALKHYKVDPKRIYLTGLSAGGGVVEYTAADLTVGKRLAAVVEFCGTTTPSMTRANNIVTNNVAFWGLHNQYDNIVSSSKTINMVNYIKSIKSTFPAKKTIPSATGHNVWQSRYPATWTENNLNIYQWMLQYARGTVSTTTNIAPVANAGSNKSITLPTNYVTLAGSGTDADGSISAYKWTKVSGPSSYYFSTTTSASTTVKSLLAGTYVFRLTVTDSKGATDYDDVTVVVNSSNIAPKASAGSDKTITLPTNYVTIYGSGTDADGSIAKYFWTKVSGPSSYSFSSTTTASTKISGLVAGTYTFRLTVTDSKGATGYDNVNVVVNSSSTTTTTYAVPGKVQAENYIKMYGVQKETTSDDGGGQDVGYIDLNDWMDYSVKTTASGTFNVTFRVASGTSTGSQFKVYNSSGTALATVTVPATGGYQSWRNVTASVKLVSGTQTLRLKSTSSARWNINYMYFATGTTTSTTTTTATKVEAENYVGMKGVQKEATKDVGGGYDVGYIDLYDWMYYNIKVGTAGKYTFTFRVASAVTGAKFQIYDTYNSVKSLVSTVYVPNTGGYQTWKTVSATISLKAGTHTLTFYSTASQRWNINYFTYNLNSTTTTSTALATDATAVVEEGTTTTSAISVSPNPFTDKFVLQVNNPYTGTMKVQIVDLNGVVRKEFLVAKNAAGSMQTYLSAGTLTAGTYFMKVQLDTWTQSTKVVKL
jgi:predicted esterase